MTCFSCSVSVGLRPNGWAESSARSTAYVSTTPLTNYTHTSSQHDLSSCIDEDAGLSISYCAACPWSRWHVYTAHIPLCLPVGSVPSERFPGHNPTKPYDHVSPSLPVWMHKVSAAVTGNLGNKSADSDLIKCAWPPGWGAWMGHAPLSSHTPSRLNFNAQTVHSQNQWHFEKSPNRWSAQPTKEMGI